MKPIIILPPGVMSESNITMLRENELCVVEATEPSAVKFIDPIPAASSRTQIENAAIQLSRRLLNGERISNSYEYKSTFAALFVDILIKGTPLDSGPTKEEIERAIFDDAKAVELRRLAREEAKKEREEIKKKGAK